jgi:electron transport complex protein RnfG
MNPVTIPAPPTNAMIRTMAVVSLICGVLIVTTHRTTRAPIQRNQEIITRSAVAQLLPGLDKQVIYIVESNGELTVAAAVPDAPKRIFAGYDASGKLLGVVLETSERGYADVIKAMYAYSPDKQAITGFQAVELKETPGLGDKIRSDPDFLANFKNLDAALDEATNKLKHAITAVKHGKKKNPWEIDSISGATISSRAVGRMLDHGVEDLVPVVHRNLDRIRKGV